MLKRLIMLLAVGGSKDLSMCSVIDADKGLATPPSPTLDVELKSQIQQVIFPWAG